MSIQEVLLYFCVCFALGIMIELSVKSRHVKKIVLVLYAVIFSVMAMYRQTSMPDSEAYLDFIRLTAEEVNKHGLLQFTGRFEYGFEFLVQVLCRLKFGERGVLFVIALIINLVGIAAFCDNKYPIVAWLVFTSFYGIYFSFVILRAGLSIIFFCYAVKCLTKKHIFRFIIATALSCLFHYSALFAYIILLFCYLIKMKSFVSEFITVCVFFFLYVFAIGNRIIFGVFNAMSGILSSLPIWARFSYYLYNFETEMFEISIRLVVNILVYVFARYLKYKNHAKDYNNIYDKVVFLGILTNLFMGSNTVVGRMVDYLMIFNVFNVCYLISESKLRLPNIIIKNTNLIKVGAVLIILILNSVFIARIII